MEQLGTIFALMQSGILEKITTAEPALKADIDTFVADVILLGNIITKLGQRGQKILVDAKPVLDALGAKAS